MYSRFMPYLDLMCCGFGGALLMFLIVASAREQVSPSRPMLVVRVRAVPDVEGEPPPAGAELGIEYRRAGERNWIRANEPVRENDLPGPASVDEGTADADSTFSKWYFQPPTALGSPAEAVFICRYPQPGHWEFKAYLADYGTRETRADTSMEVAFEFLGTVQQQFSPSLLLTPGTTTAVVTVEIP